VLSDLEATYWFLMCFSLFNYSYWQTVFGTIHCLYLRHHYLFLKIGYVKELLFHTFD
jgi:hypothetical protein